MSIKLDQILDQKSYEEIERSNPELISEIERLVGTGWGPKEIRRYIFNHSPQRWPLAVQCEQAARWVKFQENNG